MSKKTAGKDLLLTKDQCGEPLTREENRRVLLDMLDAFAACCDSRGIRYTLSGGTLLGAIRHKGFIPWDDDIDVNMPRPDIEKLYRVTGGKIGKYTLVRPGDDRFTGSFFRVYDPDTVMENALGMANDRPVYNPVFLDIFRWRACQSRRRPGNGTMRRRTSCAR